MVVNAYFDEHLDVKDSTKIAKLNQETFEAVQKLPFVKATFITKDQAAKEAKKSLGIDSDALLKRTFSLHL